MSEQTTPIRSIEEMVAAFCWTTEYMLDNVYFGHPSTAYFIRPWQLHKASADGEISGVPLEYIPTGANYHEWLREYKEDFPDYSYYLTSENWWVLREAWRFKQAIYHPPMFGQRLRHHQHQLWWHFPHISLDDPSMIAYTPNNEYGKRDRQVRTKVGRYLTQFYSDYFSAEEIRNMSASCVAYEIKWAKTREEIRAGYVDGGLSSCMSHGLNDYSIHGDIHPVEVYGTWDEASQTGFRLAYLERDGRMVARALVHRNADGRAIYVRIYGHPEGDILKHLMTAQGITHASSWEGCELLELRDHSDRVIMPYIDGSIQRVKRTGNGRWVVSSNADIYATNTNGLLYEDEDEDEDEDNDNVVCERCDDSYDPEDGDSSSEYHGWSHICYHCRENYMNWVMTADGEDLVEDDNTIEIAGEYYVDDPEHLHRLGFVRLDRTHNYDDWAKAENVVTTVAGETVHEETDGLLTIEDIHGDLHYYFEGDDLSDLDLPEEDEPDEAGSVAVRDEATQDMFTTHELKEAA